MHFVRIKIQLVMLFALFLAAFTFLLQPLISSSAEAQGQTKLVLAFYYAWYDPGSFGPGKTRFQPPAPYFSADAGVIQRHVSEARSSGIDGFVQSWYGPAPNQTESNFQTLLNTASANGFTAAVNFETGSPFFNSNNDRGAALSTLLAGHATHPAYLRVDGKPIVFFWANWLLSVDDWLAIRNQVDPNHNSIWIAEGANLDYLAVFDGLHLYNIAWSDNPAGTAASWAGSTRAAASTYGAYKYWVATAMPGFDDSLLGRGDNTIIRDRAGGSYYHSSFTGAAASSPDILIINSFNEWAEGSNIEPSLEFGSDYLQMTSQLSSAYKAGGVAPPPALPPAPTSGPPPATATFGPSPTPTNTPLPTASPTPIASPTAQPDGRIIYEAVAGDSFIGIANLFGIEVQELYALNNLTTSSTLQIGQRLILGTVSPGEQVGVPGDLPDTFIREDGAIIYLIEEGDTLTYIATKYGLSLDQLFDLNDGLGQDSIIQSGQQIIVGRHPKPQEVGGSSDQPGLQPTQTNTPPPTHTLSPTPSPTSTLPSPTAVAEAPALTPLPTLVTSTDVDQGTENITPFLILAGVVGLFAIGGGFLLFLGRSR